MKKLFFSILFAATTLSSVAQENWVTIKNGILWMDNRGKSVQAHGGNFLQVGDTWYVIGEDRSNTWNPDVNMYSTKDFVNWTFERKIIQNGVTHKDLGSSRFIERPKLMYNAKTGKYIVWCHWEQSNYGASEAACFQCDEVNGAYEYVWSGRPLDTKSRDCTTFVDEDGTAYFISTIEENQHLGMFRLSDDWLEAVEKTENFKWQAREAPALVRIDNLYYMVSSACSGWAPNQAKLATSKSVMSGWSGLSNVGNNIAYDTQASGILKIEGTEGTVYLYVGDRWQDPDLPNSKIIMFPVEFKNGKMTFEYRDEWDLDIKRCVWRETPRTDKVDKKNWKLVSTNSQETVKESAGAAKAFDGNTNTFWHSKYNGSADAHPHEMVVDMGEVHNLSNVKITPRQNNTNGWIRSYAFLVSEDGEQWTPVAGGNWLVYQCEVGFKTVPARYFKLVSLGSDSGDSYTTVAEIDVYTKDGNNDYKPVNITMYWKTGSGSWSQSSSVSVTKGQTLTFGPQPTSGSWMWIKPDGTSLASREITVENFDFDDAGTYTAFYTDQATQAVTAFPVEVKITASLTTAKQLLKNELDEADRIYDAEKLESASYLEAVNTARDIYESCDDVREVYQTLESLQEATAHYKFVNVSREEPVDVTSMYLSNPGFEDGISGGVPDGWKIDSNTSGYKDFKLSDNVPEKSQSKKSVNLWAANISSIDLYQETTLPRGEYALSAALTITNNLLTDQHVYVKANGQTYNSEVLDTVGGYRTLGVHFLIAENDTKVRVGACSTGSGSNAGGWFMADDFTLTYYGQEVFTGISSTINEEERFSAADDNVYDLTGRCVGRGKDSFRNLKNGIYIMNGKKVYINRN
ncbi:MAG: discoidin domain-containing protein [Bacteroides sp.]|nr:discoidin domain-containing protein [Roseburia sp.]MCM1347574.1 discoidin domain-containing protein [Bacteroides sp.]MCM1422041.1 discoidin domain-containing protein [Bacteroides sp.]